MRHDKVVQTADVLLKCGIAFGGSEGLDQHKEAPIALRVHRIQGQAHRVRAQDCQLAAVTDAVLAVDIQLIKIFSRKRRAERVDGRDIRLAEQRLLTHKPRVRRMLSDAIGQGIEQPWPQLRRRGTGIGHDQQSINVDAFFGIGIGDHTDDALDQNGGLSRACRSGYDDRTAARRDRVLLISRPCSRHRHPPFPEAP